MEATHKIKIDIVRNGVAPRVYAMQGDSARLLEVSLYENNAPWEIPAGASVYIAFRNSSGENYRITSLADGRPVATYAGNVAMVSLPMELTANCGEIPAVLVFLDGSGKQIATFPVSVCVTCNPAADAGAANPVSPDEFTQLMRAITLERSRIDNLATLKEGSTTGDAELLDVRVGWDGTIYPNAGDAVRAPAKTAALLLEELSELKVLESGGTAETAIGNPFAGALTDDMQVKVDVVTAQTGAKVYHRGKNLLNPADLQCSKPEAPAIDGSRWIFENPYSYALQYDIPLYLPAGKYTISKGAATNYNSIGVIYKDGAFFANGAFGSGAAKSSFTVTVPGVYTVALTIPNSGSATIVDSLQLEVGEVQTAWEPFVGEDYDVPLSGGRGTVRFDAFNGANTVYTDADEMSTTFGASDISEMLSAPFATVMFTKQNLTEERQEQARKNIHAAPIAIEKTPGSANLFNKDAPDIVVGYMFQENISDNIQALAATNISGYIPVQEGVSYTATYFAYFGTGANSRAVSFYDENKSFISRVVGTMTVDGKGFTVVAPDGACFARFHYVNSASDAGRTMFVEGAEYPAVYIAHIPSYVAEVLGVPLATQYIRELLNPLYRKTIVWDGDSICAGKAFDDEGDAWAGRIAARNSMTYKNYAVGGGTIAENVKDGSGNTKHSVSATLETMYAEYPNADYIIFEGGTNDADLLGSHLNGATPEKFGSFTVSDFSGNYDRSTFCGALESIFFRATNYWKGKKICFIVAHKMGRSTVGYTADKHNRRNYFETAMAICKKWGIPVLNLWDDCYLNPTLPHHYTNGATWEANKSAGNLYADGQHLLSAGYDYTADIVNNWLKTL